MGHLVLGFPSLERSYQMAREYVLSGVKYLELQIPFSHPTADGIVITDANRTAVETNGVSINDCMELFEKLRAEFPEQAIIPMTYLNKVFSFGIMDFVETLKQQGIQQLIIPDLPFDAPQADFIREQGLDLVPVIAPNIKMERLHSVLALNPTLIYIMSDFKITGGDFGLNKAMDQCISTIRSKSKAQIGIGFGISTGEDVANVLEIADYAIVGSSLLRAEAEGKLSDKLSELVG